MATINHTRKAAYEAAVYCENMWQTELERIYGNAASDARYDARGKATPMLKTLHDAKNAAARAWALLGKIERNEISA